MRVLFALTGAAVVILTMVDFVWTTLSVRGAGPMTARFSAAVWAACRAVGRGRLAPALTAAGPAILVATLALWITLLWLGWLLIFLADPEAVVRSSDQEEADLSGRIYFVGFIISTLGVGDLVPKGGLWQVLTPLAALNGLIVTTVAITYLLSVLSAVIAVRQLAAYINAVGETPQGFVVTGWDDGRGFSGLADHLSSMTPGLLHTSQSHLAYPILHYFRSERAEVAPGPAVALLDEALTLLEHGVAPGHRPPPAVVQPLRNAIDTFLDRLEPRYVRAADEVPPPPILSGLREAGIPTVDGDEFAAAVAERRRHRRLLLAMVREEGWEWRDLEWPGRRNGRRRGGAGRGGSGHPG